MLTSLSLPRPSLTTRRSIESPLRTAQRYSPRFSITAATGTAITSLKSATMISTSAVTPGRTSCGSPSIRT